MKASLADMARHMPNNALASLWGPLIRAGQPGHGLLPVRAEEDHCPCYCRWKSCLLTRLRLCTACTPCP